MFELQKTIEFYSRSVMFLLRTSSERAQQSFFPLLCFDLHWKNLSGPSITKNTLICYNIILKLFSSQSWHKGFYCYENMLNSKECSIRLLIVSYQPNLKSFLKYSLGQQNNIATTLSRALPQRYVAEFEHVRTWYSLHIMTDIFKWSHMAEVVTYSVSHTRFIWLIVKYSFYV